MYGRVRHRVVEVARDKGYMFTRGAWKGKINLQKLSRDTGVSTHTLAQFVRRPERVNNFYFVTLAKLCHGLGVQPSDLIEYIPDDPGRRSLDVDRLIGAS